MGAERPGDGPLRLSRHILNRSHPLFLREARVGRDLRAIILRRLLHGINPVGRVLGERVAFAELEQGAIIGVLDPLVLREAFRPEDLAHFLRQGLLGLLLGLDPVPQGRRIAGCRAAVAETLIKGTLHSEEPAELLFVRLETRQLRAQGVRRLGMAQVVVLQLLRGEQRDQLGAPLALQLAQRLPILRPKQPVRTPVHLLLQVVVFLRQVSHHLLLLRREERVDLLAVILIGHVLRDLRPVVHPQQGPHELVLFPVQGAQLTLHFRRDPGEPGHRIGGLPVAVRGPAGPQLATPPRECLRHIRDHNVPHRLLGTAEATQVLDEDLVVRRLQHPPVHLAVGQRSQQGVGRVNLPDGDLGDRVRHHRGPDGPGGECRLETDDVEQVDQGSHQPEVDGHQDQGDSPWIHGLRCRMAWRARPRTRVGGCQPASGKTSRIKGGPARGRSRPPPLGLSHPPLSLLHRPGREWRP